MPYTANRKKTIQVKFFVDKNELATIKQRMAELGMENLSAYLRTALEGVYPIVDQEEKAKQEITQG